MPFGSVYSNCLLTEQGRRVPGCRTEADSPDHIHVSSPLYLHGDKLDLASLGPALYNRRLEMKWILENKGNKVLLQLMKEWSVSNVNCLEQGFRKNQIIMATILAMHSLIDLLWKSDFSQERSLPCFWPDQNARVCDELLSSVQLLTVHFQKRPVT